MAEDNRDLTIPGALGLITTLLHLLTATDTYGVFRDELYYVAMADTWTWAMSITHL